MSEPTYTKEQCLRTHHAYLQEHSESLDEMEELLRQIEVIRETLPTSLSKAAHWKQLAAEIEAKEAK